MAALDGVASRARREEEAQPEERYADDEQRRAAKQIRPALRVAAAGGHLLRHSSSTCHKGHAIVVVPRIWPPGARNAAHARLRSRLLGFTLSEVVVSTLIVAVGLVGLLSAFLSGLVLVESSRNMAVAAADARTVFEEMRRLSSTSLLQVTNPATPWSTWSRQQGLTVLSNETITEEFWVPKTNQAARINRGNPPGMVEASLTVSWSERGRQRSAQFTSLITKR